jgi:hypothetical protein
VKERLAAADASGPDPTAWDPLSASEMALEEAGVVLERMASLRQSGNRSQS